MASSLTLTIPMIFPSCQLLIIPLIKVALQGNRSFVAQELICSCCSFPALNCNPQLGTLQLATMELGTVSPRIRAPFGGELGDPALVWVDGSLQDGLSPLQPPKEGDELKSPPEPGIPQPASSGHPQCHWVVSGVHRSLTALLPNTLESPMQTDPSRSSQGLGGFVQCDSGDKNGAGRTNSSLNPHLCMSVNTGVHPQGPVSRGWGEGGGGN